MADNNVADRLKGTRVEIDYQRYVDSLVKMEQVKKDLDKKYGGPIKYQEGKDLSFETTDRKLFGGFKLTDGRGATIGSSQDVTAYLDAQSSVRVMQNYFENGVKKELGEKDFKPFDDYAKRSATARIEASEKAKGSGSTVPMKPKDPEQSKSVER